MIKFFRKIRQNSIKNSKTINYLKYAFGEIILVMIGILLALQVNNLNEGRKDSIKEQKILSQLTEEYDVNLLQLEQIITRRNKIIQAANKVLQYIDEPKNANNDSLISQLSILIGAPTFRPIQNNLINSGNILLIKNEKLSRLLSSWPSDVLSIQGIEDIWRTKMFESVVPLFIDIKILRESLYNWWNDEKNLTWILDGKGVNPFRMPNSNNTIKSREILEKNELEGIITFAISANYAANLQSQVLRKRILKIKELLNQEIDVK